MNDTSITITHLNYTDRPVRVLGVILARGNSQGLPGKHLLPLLGRPVIRYTFDHARSSRLLTHTVVSSDCPAILTEARSAGFDVVERDPSLATSDATVQDVLLDAMDRVGTATGVWFDAVVTLYGNVPVRPLTDGNQAGGGCIDGAIEMLVRTHCHSVRSFAPVGKWHPQWMAIMRDGHVSALHAGSVHRRQDLSPLFLHDGAVVASSREIMEHARRNRDDPHAFFGIDRRGFEVGPGETVEVDQRRDLYWAEAVLRDRTEMLGAPVRAAG